MSYGYRGNFPLPDLEVREGDMDPIPWTLYQGDGVTPVNLGANPVALRLRAIRGDQTAAVYYSNTPSGSASVIISSPAGGAIILVPTSTMFVAAAELYRAYFEVLVSGFPRSVPQQRDLWISVLPKIA